MVLKKYSLKKFNSTMYKVLFYIFYKAIDVSLLYVHFKIGQQAVGFKTHLVWWKGKSLRRLL